MRLRFVATLASRSTSPLRILVAAFKFSEKLRRPVLSPYANLGPDASSSTHACVTLTAWPKRSSNVFIISLNVQPLLRFTTSNASPATNLGRYSTCWASVSRSLSRCVRTCSRKKGNSAGLPLNCVGFIPLRYCAFHIAAT